jgi:hypothetical protein
MKTLIIAGLVALLTAGAAQAQGFFRDTSSLEGRITYLETRLYAADSADCDRQLGRGLLSGTYGPGTPYPDRQSAIDACMAQRGW